MLTDDVAVAILRMQNGVRRLETRSLFLTERYEAALDDLVRNPHRTGEPRHLIRNALSNARKRNARRARLHSVESLSDKELVVLDPNSSTATQLFEWNRTLETAPLAEQDRKLLRRLADGEAVADLATYSGHRTSTFTFASHEPALGFVTSRGWQHEPASRVPVARCRRTRPRAAGKAGTYVLCSPNGPVYAGRSDTDLRRRLMDQARRRRAVFFDSPPTRRHTTRMLLSRAYTTHSAVGRQTATIQRFRPTEVQTRVRFAGTCLRQSRGAASPARSAALAPL